MMKKTLFVIYTAVFFMMSVIINASAEQIKLSVSQVVSYEGYDSSSERFVGNYTLTSIDKEAPMPEGTVNGKYEFSIVGSSTYVLPEIKTNTQGQWEYTITGNNLTLKPSDKVIYLTLYAVDKGGDLELFFVARNSEGKKSNLIFNILVINEKTQSSSQSSEIYSSKTSSSGIIYSLKTGYISNIIAYVIALVLSAAVFLLLKHRTD